MSEIEDVLIQRGEKYGDYKLMANMAQSLKKRIRTGGYNDLSYDKMESLDMICTKIARIVVGDSDHKDSWRDIAGYARLIAEDLPE